MDTNLQLPDEIWRPIIGHEGRYEVSNLGRFKTLAYKGMKGIVKIMRLSNERDGYKVVSILLRSKRVHRLVAQAFIPNPENKPQVNHINGDKADNRVENLEWATASENIVHSHRIGLKVPSRGSQCSWSILTEENVSEILKRHAQKEKQRDIAASMGISYKLLNNIVKRRGWAHVPLPT